MLLARMHQQFVSHAWGMMKDLSRLRLLFMGEIESSGEAIGRNCIATRSIAVSFSSWSSSERSKALVMSSGTIHGSREPHGTINDGQS